MVECEFASTSLFAYAVSGFNRYMVECEFDGTDWVFDEYPVLIDTWWNVNFRLPIHNCLAQIVLIDTWWNVNSETNFKEDKTMKVLIDTWWNVNQDM